MSALFKVYFNVVNFIGFLDLISSIWFQSLETFETVVVLKSQTLAKPVRRHYFCSINSYDVRNKYLQPIEIVCTQRIDPIGQLLHGWAGIYKDICVNFYTGSICLLFGH